MRTTTANYTTYNANLYKNPVYIVEFGAITTKYVSGTWNNIGSYTTKKYLRNIRASYGKIDIHEPNLTASTFDVTIVDKSSEFISFMNTNSLWGKTMTIKIGFQELDYADFVTLTPTNTVVTDIRLESDLITWIIEGRDNLFNLIGAKFNDTGIDLLIATLSSSLTAGETSTISVTTSTPFSIQTDIDGAVNDTEPTARVFVCVKIDSEIIQYTGTSGGNSLTTLTRGLGSSIAAAHSMGAEVIPGIGFKCDPLRTMLHLLTSSTAGTNGRYDLTLNTNTDTFSGVLKDGINTEISTDDINIESIEQLGWRLFHEIEYDTNGYFYIFANERNDVLDTIQEKLLKPHGLYLYINGGKIDIGHNDYVYFSENFSASDTLTDSDIKRVNGLDHSGYDQVYDKVVFNYDYDHATTDFGTNSEQTHNTTAATYYDSNRLIVDHHGATSSMDTDQIKHLVRYRFLSFADISSIIKADSYHSKLLLEPGDTPSVTFSNLANVDSGSRGWTTQKAVLLGQELAMGLDESTVEHELRVFTIPGYVDNAVSGYYSINKVAEGSIDDTSLAVSTDLTSSTEAADAYYDNSSSAYQADRIIFFIRVTPPNFGGGSDFETIDLQICWMDNTPTIQNSDRRRYINFNPQSSTAFTIALDLYGLNSTADTPDRVKVDWNATTATGSEVPTVEFVGVWFVKLNLT
jgi:hypothetical protein